jgi:predicted RNA binding protein YcfA (HicA-like mRNA interferase family)
MAERNAISGREAVRAFERAGWERVGRFEGYVALAQDGSRVTLIVPQSRTLSVGTIRALLRHSGLAPERFFELLLGDQGARP